jgi:hypothetical protein
VRVCIIGAFDFMLYSTSFKDYSIITVVGNRGGRSGQESYCQLDGLKYSRSRG